MIWGAVVLKSLAGLLGVVTILGNVIVNCKGKGEIKKPVVYLKISLCVNNFVRFFVYWVSPRLRTKPIFLG